MNTRVILSIVFISLGLLIAAVPKNTTREYKLTPEQLLEEVNNGEQYVSPDMVADMLIQKDPSLQLIDVRSLAQFEKYHLPGAIHIPLIDILSDEWIDQLNQDVKMNVFYSNGTLDADQAWMITRQLGYNNNFVLQGGLNYWAETIINPIPPASTNPDEEIAKYDFRKGASQALGGGGNVIEANTDVQVKKPVIKRVKKKKRVQGGC